MSEFLSEITYREVSFTLEALDSGQLPPYIGSSLRGALGHLLRPALCDEGACTENCRQPASCRYFSLFEQARNAAGRNVLKPFVILAPVTAELETIAIGGPIVPPYSVAPPNGNGPLPEIHAEAPQPVQPGGRLRAGIRLLGPVALALPAITDAIARHGIAIGHVRFALLSAHDSTGRLLFDRRFPGLPSQMPALMRLSSEPEPARRIRIVFQTPTILKLDSQPSFDPLHFAARFFEHSLARAVQIHESVMQRPRLPWMDAPPVRTRIAGHRLFRYVLPRLSFRQGKWLDFDGILGYLDLEGDFEPGMPYARAAEILNFGQKATFGLGSVRVLVLE